LKLVWDRQPANRREARKNCFVIFPTFSQINTIISWKVPPNNRDSSIRRHRLIVPFPLNHSCSHGVGCLVLSRRFPINRGTNERTWQSVDRRPGARPC
jgi:hypothetical protein